WPRSSVAHPAWRNRTSPADFCNAAGLLDFGLPCVRCGVRGGRGRALVFPECERRCADKPRVATVSRVENRKLTVSVRPDVLSGGGDEAAPIESGSGPQPATYDHCFRV